MNLTVASTLITLAMLCLVVAGVDLNQSQNNNVQVPANDPVTDIFVKIPEKGEEAFGTKNLTQNQFYLPAEPCQCSATLKQALALFDGPSPPYLPTYREGRAQTIKLSGLIFDSDTCRLADGNNMCEQPKFKLTDFETRQEITTFPHKGITLNQLTLTLEPQSYDPVGLQKVMLSAYYPSKNYLLETVEIQYFINSEPNQQRKLSKQDDQDIPEPDTGHHRRLGTPGYCTNSPSLLNLCNTAAYAEQLSFYLTVTSQTSVSGCDGDIIAMNTANPPAYYNEASTKVVSSQTLGTSSTPQWWRVTFTATKSIKSFLIIDRSDSTPRFPGYRVSVGINADINLNPTCVTKGTMTQGGWYMCTSSMTGIYFGIDATNVYLNFVEAMAYTQEAIQMNAGVTFSVIGTETSTYPASNALQHIVFLLESDSRQHCVVVNQPAAGNAKLSIKFKAQVVINGVVLIPGYRNATSSWPSYQTNVAIYGKTIAGTQQLCEVLTNYYTLYSEASCKIQANEIILEQRTSSHDLRFCGFGALADCDCSTTSFNPAFQTTTSAASFVSPTSLSVQVTDVVQTITFNTQTFPDTVSSVCGTADGFTKCGQRSISFKDKQTGLDITVWPYWGYTYASSVLTLDPSQALSQSVLTATISMVNSPSVFLSQDITSTVQGGKTMPSTPVPPIISVNADANATIKWTAPSSGGTAITAYTIAIKQSDGSYSSEIIHCNGSNSSIVLATSCIIPISSLQAAPFNLDLGSTISVTVIATNILGSSAVSIAGNGILQAIPSVPAAPSTLVNQNIFVTITWAAPANGGSKITEYIVAIRQNDGITFTPLSANCIGVLTSCTVPIDILLVAPYNLAWGASIWATVLAKNVVGSSAASPRGNGAVILTNPGAPSSLSNDLASTTSSAIALTWIVPTFFGGKASVDYRVSWDQGTSNFIVLASGITTTSYLTSAKLTPGMVYKFKVDSRNTFGFSTSSSNEVSVTIKLGFLPPTAPLKLANNAALTSQNQIGLTWTAPSSDGGSVVIDYQISSKTGAGAYSVLATGITTTSYTAGSLTANVVYGFKVTARNSIGLGAESSELNVATSSGTKIVEAVSVASQAPTESTGTILSQISSNALLETVQCTPDASGVLSCGSQGGPQLFMDPLTGQFNTFNPKTTKAKETNIQKAVVPPKQPTLEMTKLSPKGEFFIQFSEPVGLTDLIQQPTRKLKVSKAKTQKKNNVNSTEVYLLSDKHLKITIQSENKTAPVFSWHASNITSTEIGIQMVFQDPLYISNSFELDKLTIKLLPPAIQFMKSLTSGMLTKDPLQTVVLVIPPQVILGATIEAAQAASDSLKDVGQSSTMANIGVQIVLSQSMAQMWSMVNAQQIIMTYQLMNLKMPGNVIMVITQLANICDFNIFPTDDFLGWLFYFTPTNAPGVGFESMGNDNASLILYLGSSFLFLMLAGLQYLLYGCAYGCRHYDKLINKIEQKLKPGLIWATIYVLLVETYLDFAIGSALRLEQPRFETPSDYFDYGFACIGAVITLALPFYCFFFLKRNINLLDEEDFKSKHGSLYDGFITDNALKLSDTINMVGWFMFRRFLTAVNLVCLRNQTIWIQLTLNVYLSLIDVCVKIELSPYESRLGGIMEKLNDLFVLTLSYFPYLFTDLIPSQEDKYYIGWYYTGIIGMLLVANLSVMMKTAYQDVQEKITQMVKKCQLKKATEAQNAKRKAQEDAHRKLEQNTVDGVIFTIAKPRAIDFDSDVDFQARVAQFKAFNRYERKKARIAAIAQKQQQKNTVVLAPIPEIEELSEIELPNTPIQINDLEATMIHDESSSNKHQSASQPSESQEASSSQYQCDWSSSQEAPQFQESHSSFETLQENSQPQTPKQKDAETRRLQFEKEQNNIQDLEKNEQQSFFVSQIREMINFVEEEKQTEKMPIQIELISNANFYTQKQKEHYQQSQAMQAELDLFEKKISPKLKEQQEILDIPRVVTTMWEYEPKTKLQLCEQEIGQARIELQAIIARTAREKEKIEKGKLNLIRFWQ